MSEPERELVEQTGNSSIWIRKPHAEKLLQVDLEQLNADIAASQDRVSRLLDDCDLVAGHVSQLRAGLEKTLEKGSEVRAFAAALSQALHLLAGAQDLYNTNLRLFAGDEIATARLQPQLQDAIDLAAWAQQLLARLDTPSSPSDESRMPPSPGVVGPGQAPGYVSIDEARRRLGISKP
jgi:hypothetical protein